MIREDNFGIYCNNCNTYLEFSSYDNFVVHFCNSIEIFNHSQFIASNDACCYQQKPSRKKYFQVSLQHSVHVPSYASSSLLCRPYTWRTPMSETNRSPMLRRYIPCKIVKTSAGIHLSHRFCLYTDI